MNYINPHEFYLETNGRIIDVDGYYGGQCWDLFAYFTRKYCGKTFSCISTGYVIDLWTHFNECGLSPYFDRVTSNYQDGDWLIWKAPSMITRYSHIAMFRKDNGDNTNVILTQNPNGNPNYVYQMVCNYQGVVGALRPKVSKPPIKEEIKPVERDFNKIQIHVLFDDTNRYRKTPEINNVNILGLLKKGYYNVLEEKQTNYKWVRIDKDVWVSCLEGYVLYLDIIKIDENNPITEKKEEDNTNTLEEHETPVIEAVKPKNKVYDVILKLITKILEYLRKEFKK